ncbi:hypothetical protein BDZ89DRAFT_695028 [Hymenopellis radicata]|nr:hypothetical protein BDZ89DRAFT_695028 [Hymenopellis radicata]
MVENALIIPCKEPGRGFGLAEFKLEGDRDLKLSKHAAMSSQSTYLMAQRLDAQPALSDFDGGQCILVRGYFTQSGVSPAKILRAINLFTLLNRRDASLFISLLTFESVAWPLSLAKSEMDLATDVSESRACSSLRAAFEEAIVNSQCWALDSQKMSQLRSASACSGSNIPSPAIFRVSVIPVTPKRSDSDMWPPKIRLVHTAAILPVQSSMDWDEGLVV